MTEPIRLHADAKRYLCAVEPDYRGKLSDASIHTMALQGGIMDAEEADALCPGRFLREPPSPCAAGMTRARWPALMSRPSATSAPMLERLVNQAGVSSN